MKNKRKYIERLVSALISVVLLSSFLAFSSIPGAMAESKTEGEQGINALAMGQAWVTSYDSAGGYADLLYLPFGHYYGYRTELSPYVGAVVDTVNNSYVINWRPNLVGDSMYVCGVRVAYKLPDGAGGFEAGFHYVHIPGTVLLPRTSTVNWGTDWTGGCIYLKSGPSYVVFNKNLNIPDGSRIDYLRVYYYRESLGYLPFIKR
jgi:hypothetical protein